MSSLAEAQPVKLVNRWKNETIGIVNGKPVSTAAATDTWLIEKTGEGNFVRLKNTTTGTYLHNQNSALEVGAIQPGWWSAQWTMTAVDGHFHIINRWKSTYLHNQNGTLELGALGAPGWWSAQWKTVPAVTAPPAPPTSGSFTFSNIMGNAVNVDIYKENGTMNPAFIKRITNNQTFTIDDTKIGDVFSFKPDDDNLRIAPYTITAFGGTHSLRAGTRYSSAKGQKINTKANEYSFDIFKIDPIYIDYTADKAIVNKSGKEIGRGGMRKQIFKSLYDNDLDWKSYQGEGGDIALKNQFRKESINEGSDKSGTQNCYSDQSFKESFTGNIGVSGGNEKSGKGGGSASFSYTTENSSSKRNIYTYSRSFHTIYDVVLEKSAIELTDEFKSAVAALPETAGPAYQKFIADWGTHYATRVGYGGLMIGVITVDEDTYMSSKGWSIDLKGEAEKQVKVEAGFGYSQNRTFNDINSKSNSLYYYKGGTGGSGGSWSATQGTAQPLRVQLSRLPELLEARLFNNGMTPAQLAIRQSLLQSAITDYVGSPYDLGKILKPRLFKISNVRWKMIEEKDGLETPNIYGDVTISLNDKAPNTDPASYDNIERQRRGLPLKPVKPRIDQSQTLFAFSRSDRPGSRVIAAKGYVENTGDDKQITFLVPRSYEDLSKYYSFTLSARLFDQDNIGGNGEIGNKSETIVLANIQQGKQTINVQLRSAHGDIDVMADVEEIILPD